jgi:hypothetical protein
MAGVSPGRLRGGAGDKRPRPAYRKAVDIIPYHKRAERADALLSPMSDVYGQDRLVLIR